MRALLVGGSPQPSSPALVARLAARADVVVAIDRGAESCRAAGVVPQVFCGDCDTVSAQVLAWVRTQAVEVCTYPVAKDYTDLTLGIERARELAQAAGEPLELALCCASAGRMDHALVVFGVLAEACELAPRLIEDGFECRILSPGSAPLWQLGPDARDHTFSFVALSDDALVSLGGMRWELDGSPSRALRDKGLSNIVDASNAWVRCDRGVLAAFLIS